MLTRHLYLLKEVRAALLYTIKQGRVQEAQFWLEELEVSNQSEEASALLCIGWILTTGLRRLAWLEAWSSQKDTKEGRRRLCIQLTRCKERDSSIWLLLWSLAIAKEPLPDAPGCLVSTWSRRWNEPESIFWDGCSTKLSTRSNPILGALQTIQEPYRLFARAVAVTLTVCIAHVPASSWLPCTPVELGVFDTPTVSVRAGRLYTIPYDCLYGMTERGGGHSTDGQLQSLCIEDLCGSRPVPDSLDTIAVELFWDTHFPWTCCDHPDEWSSEDRAKSHGPGVPIGPLGRWWSNWIPKEHLFVWGTVHNRLLTWVRETRSPTTSIFSMLHALYKTVSYVGPNYPVKKEFVLV